MFDLNNYVEALAEKEHESWSRWQLYFHTKGFLGAFYDDKEYFGIPVSYFRALESQANTGYNDLSESEKEGDREEARKLEEILKKIYQDGYNAGYKSADEELYHGNIE